VTIDTSTCNRRMRYFDQHEAVWLFGYGSLIFKADFPWQQRRPASIQHWQRRFWQGSHDHRGTPEQPGRVVTLVPQQGARCDGMAYLISPAVFDQLDFREKNGYYRCVTDLRFSDQRSAEGLVYIATQDNPAFLGPASEADIALHINFASGPSGSNIDYLAGLAAALRELKAHDPHVFEIERALNELQATTAVPRSAARRKTLP
jgi:cation transport regulator ChaC